MASAVDERLSIRTALAALCARNATAELHYAGEDDGIHTARLRLLTVEDGQFCTDKPQNVDDEVDLDAGQTVTMYVAQGEARLAFDCRVIKVNRIVRLNAKQRVVGVAWSLPREIQDQQRRRDYRVSIASAGVSCTIVPESEDYPGACDWDAEVREVTLANISARGLAFVIEEARPQQFPFGRRLFVEFVLPGMAEPFLILAETRHAQDLHTRRRTIRVGCRILPLPIYEPMGLRRQLSRFVVAEQRRKLRRRK